MKHLIAITIALTLSSVASARLIVHEWGTFTSLVGSNGQPQNGMYHEDEDLPDFVHHFGEKKEGPVLSLFAIGPRPAPAPPPFDPCQRPTKIPCEFLSGQVITQKMETPVVYFYADLPQRVQFDVSFPGGIISQSFPAPVQSLPIAIPGVELKNGSASYVVDVLPSSSLIPPAVPESNIYGHARNVASAIVQSGNEVEKFIFYRGLGEFKAQLQTTSLNGTLKLKNTGRAVIPNIFVIDTTGSKGEILSVGKLDAQAETQISPEALARLKTQAKPQSSFLQSARTLLFLALVKAGLYPDEAYAMIDTWEHGYFATPGLRVLYVLSPEEVESILPIQVRPVPDQLSRAFVGRIEVLLDTEENILLEEIQRKAFAFNVNRLGRLAHPTLLRVREVAQQRGVQTPFLANVFDALIRKSM